MRRVVILAEAAEDIEQARDFYDAQELGIGDYCADSLVADIESLALYHGIHSRHFGFPRMLANRFPFGIYYREEKNETQVFAVLDLRREPNWIRKELTDRDA
ncbi:MAG: type II toxin-antitoxin system RelE/ParE family toxin [Verrucomicrobiota bacterium]